MGARQAQNHRHRKTPPHKRTPWHNSQRARNAFVYPPTPRLDHLTAPQSYRGQSCVGGRRNDLHVRLRARRVERHRRRVAGGRGIARNGHRGQLVCQRPVLYRKETHWLKARLIEGPKVVSRQRLGERSTKAADCCLSRIDDLV